MKHNRVIALHPTTLVLRALLIGTVGGAALCALLLFCAAAILQAAGTLPQALLEPLILGICCASCFFAGFLSGKISRKKGLFFGAGCGLLLFILCFFGGLALSHTLAPVSGITRFAAMVLSGALGGVLSMQQRQKLP